MLTTCELLIALLSLPLGAQTSPATLKGLVRDSAGSPIPAVEITVGNGGAMARTDSAGRFIVSGLAAGDTKVDFRRLGYEAKTTSVTLHAGETDSVTVVLKAIPHQLAGVEATTADAANRYGMAGFYRRKASGNGHFVTRAEIEARNIHLLSDALRMIPGVQLVRQRNGSTLLRIGRTSSGGNRDCPPEWVIDGVKAIGMRVDDMAADDLEGIEIYNGGATIPPEFNVGGGTAGCGVIVLWTKRP